MREYDINRKLFHRAHYNIIAKRFKEALLERLRSEHQLDMLCRKDIIATKRQELAYKPEIRWQDEFPPNVMVPVPPGVTVPEWIEEQQKAIDEKWIKRPKLSEMVGPRPSEPEYKVKAPASLAAEREKGIFKDGEGIEEAITPLAHQLKASIEKMIERKKEKGDDKFTPPF